MVRERKVLWTCFSFSGAGPRHELPSARCGPEYLVALTLPKAGAHEKYQSAHTVWQCGLLLKTTTSGSALTISEIIFSRRRDWLCSVAEFGFKSGWGGPIFFPETQQRLNLPVRISSPSGRMPILKSPF